jgi:hypothetical protein
MTINVDNVKLVDEDILAPSTMVEEAVEIAVQDAAGWGCTIQAAILLRLAYELKQAQRGEDAAEKLASELDEATRQLKGLQLQVGRLKKQVKGQAE